MDRVIATQPQVFGIAAGTSGELLVDSDRNQLRVELLEGRERLSMLLFPKAIEAASSRKRRPALGIGEDARRCWVGTAPELGG